LLHLLYCGIHPRISGKMKTTFTSLLFVAAAVVSIVAGNECPVGGKVWSSCGSPCAKTCEDPLASQCVAPLACVGRCECPADKPILRRRKCIKEQECRCKPQMSRKWSLKRCTRRCNKKSTKGCHKNCSKRCNSHCACNGRRLSASILV